MKKNKSNTETEQDARTTECIASLLALAKFSELIASASEDKKYQSIVANALQSALQHGAQAALDGAASEKDTENLIQIRAWFSTIAEQYVDRQKHDKLH